MAKGRSRRELVERCAALAAQVRAALARLPGGAGDPAVVEALWQAEGLGTLLWALTRIELPPYDRAFDRRRVLAADLEAAQLRDGEELRRAREAARLWHWRARTAALEAGGAVVLPERWRSFAQLVAATAMRGHERGLLPRPLRGDFPAFGTAFRELSPKERSVVHVIAWERHRALNWACGLGASWDDVPTDT